MNDVQKLPQLVFPVTASDPGVWRRDEQTGAVIAAAPARSDFYINPGGADSADAETLLNAATLLGLPGHQIGFEAQSPTGDGCTVTFDRIAFTAQRLTELRDGS